MPTVTAYPSSYTGGAQWSWVSYAYVEGDGAFAQLNIGTGSSDLHFSGFGLNIPSNATINSVTIYRSSKRDGISGTVYHQIQAYKGSTPVGTNHQGPALTNEASETSTSNTGTWTAEELNNSFGIYLAANRVYNYSYLDYVKVVVDYSIPPLSLSLSGIASTAAIGAITLIPKIIILPLLGIPSTLQIGTITLEKPELQVLALEGIPSTASLGTITLEAYIKTAYLAGIFSTLKIGKIKISNIKRPVFNLIRILDSNLQLVAILDDFIHLSYTRRWQKSTDFTLYVPHYSKNISHLGNDNFVHVIREGKDEYIGIIEHGEIKLDENGKASEVWQFKGGGILARRICLPPAGLSHDEQSGAAETVMKAYVNNNVISPVDTTRSISILTNEADGVRGANVAMRARYNKLVDLLEETAIAGEVGWEVVKSGSGLQFKVVPGVNRSTAQSAAAPIIFSPDFGNIKTLGFLWSRMARANYAYVAGQGEAEERAVVTVPTLDGPTGLARREIFIDARDLDTNEKLLQRGQAKLGEQGPEERLEAEILKGGPFRYRSDWDLGDIVTVRNLDWGILAHLRVSEITVTLEASGERIDVAFGAPWPNFLQHVKRAVDAPGPVMRA